MADMENAAAENRKHRSGYSLAENILITFIITFAAAAFCYEKYMPESFMKFYRFIMTTACMLTWLWLSFSGGARNKWRFLVYTAVFWLLPLIIIYLSDSGPEFCRMSITLYVISEFFRMMFINFAECIGNAFRLNAVPVLLIMLMLCVFAFLAGNFLSDKLKKGNYTFLKC